MYFNIVRATAMQNGDEASSSIILAGQALLVKMLITLKPRGIFTSNFVYLCTFNIVRPLPCKTLTEALPSIILASQTDYYISNSGCAYYCQLIITSKYKRIRNVLFAFLGVKTH